jgi:hypothetical protein
MDKTLKEKIDAWADADEHTKIPFRKRVQNFWKWFTDNEKKLSQIVENRGKSDSENAVEFITAGTDLINEEVHFNLGGTMNLLSLLKVIPPCSIFIPMLCRSCLSNSRTNGTSSLSTKVLIRVSHLACMA